MPPSAVVAVVAVVVVVVAVVVAVVRVWCSFALNDRFKSWYHQVD